ncbi:hypothetical protein SAY86_001433 [Trapa natans]|uniref:non-specific serine/threonine protein kinase n=1 Tax=Trapa natans TaxID=22666 RepID=A0AAN7MW04_TRANT|nr:hypothetical protein SAY86_001433 [Trapa natans]
MVSSQFSTSAKTQACKRIPGQLFLLMNSQDPVAPDHVEMDFSDVFGPLPSQQTIEGSVSNSVAGLEATELIYNEPAVVHNRSHSFVGPSSYLGQSLKLSMLTLHENEELTDLVETVNGEAAKELPKLSTDDEETGISVKDIQGIYGDTQSVGIEDFEILKVVGQGAFGKVFQVIKKGTSEIYAMKVMRKDKIMEKNHAEYMKAERDILTKIDHPFIVQLRYSFQTKYRLYLVLDFINGGHLFFQLYHHGLFREDLARIYAAEIVSAVSHLHANGIMHRDLKPENILLDADGHVILTDFGLAKEFEENARSNSMCGTVEYMSPEIILGKGHDKSADWWSVGVLLFEMLTGKVALWFHKLSLILLDFSDALTTTSKFLEIIHIGS